MLFEALVAYCWSVGRCIEPDYNRPIQALIRALIRATSLHSREPVTVKFAIDRPGFYGSVQHDPPPLVFKVQALWAANKIALLCGADSW
jgi:hypothetical protein